MWQMSEIGSSSRITERDLKKCFALKYGQRRAKSSNAQRAVTFFQNVIKIPVSSHCNVKNICLYISSHFVLYTELFIIWMTAVKHVRQSKNPP